MRRVDLKHMFQAWSCFIHPSFRHTYSQFLPLKPALSHLHSIGCHHPNLQSEKTEVQENNKTSQDPNKSLYLHPEQLYNEFDVSLWWTWHFQLINVPLFRSRECKYFSSCLQVVTVFLYLQSGLTVAQTFMPIRLWNETVPVNMKLDGDATSE